MRIKAIRTFMGGEGFVRAGQILSVSDERGAALIAKGYAREEATGIATVLAMPAQPQEAAEPGERPLSPEAPLTGIRIGATDQPSASPQDPEPETLTFPSSEDEPT